MKELLSQFEISPEKAYKDGLQAALNLCSENFQLKEVEYDGSLIRFIENPSERVKLLAVQQDGHPILGDAIQFIEDPSEKIQLKSVEEKPSSIQYIKKPSERTQIAAIQKKIQIHFNTSKILQKR